MQESNTTWTLNESFQSVHRDTLATSLPCRQNNETLYTSGGDIGRSRCDWSSCSSEYNRPCDPFYAAGGIAGHETWCMNYGSEACEFGTVDPVFPAEEFDHVVPLGTVASQDPYFCTSDGLERMDCSRSGNSTTAVLNSCMFEDLWRQGYA